MTWARVRSDAGGCAASFGMLVLAINRGRQNNPPLMGRSVTSSNEYFIVTWCHLGRGGSAFTYMVPFFSDSICAQVLKVGENAVVEVAEAWGGMSSLVELEAQVSAALVAYVMPRTRTRVYLFSVRFSVARVLARLLDQAKVTPSSSPASFQETWLPCRAAPATRWKYASTIRTSQTECIPQTIESTSSV